MLYKFTLVYSMLITEIYANMNIYLNIKYILNILHYFILNTFISLIAFCFPLFTMSFGFDYIVYLIETTS